MAASARPTPRETVAQACERWGEPEVARRCAALIGGAHDGGLVALLGSRAATDEAWMARSVNQYWMRVWGARALLYAWSTEAEPAVVAGLADDHWRVREMCAKVAVQRAIGAAADPAADLVVDPVERVRVAALRVLGAVGEGEHAAGVRTAYDDDSPAVQRAAYAALRSMSERLDRDLDEA
ncbi:HEAT repeat domain-containing protein [Luteipulveratus flavus]|uniref:HEAT repeat domain-containing protein n=1 Tax=Luteipulveratus flavus TaxID=3031728 RepID=A0ABT6C4H3_9MICO|nr:hypothetical protein [Luteipulveratus sp. YIM 133296]MDF8263187.1 hypothetical protein [Luteipulveratus sp. YIM 133296]